MFNVPIQYQHVVTPQQLNSKERKVNTMTKFQIHDNNNTSDYNTISVNAYDMNGKVTKTEKFNINNAYSFNIAKIIDYNKIRLTVKLKEAANLHASAKKSPKIASGDLYQVLANTFIDNVKDNMAIVGNQMFIRNALGMLAPFCKASDVEWIQLINPMLQEIVPANTKNQIIAEIKSQLNQQSAVEPTIQFIDSYIIDNKLYKGIYNGIVKWVIPYKALPFITSGKFTKVVPEIDETFNFINNNDPEKKNYMFQLLGMMFMTNPETKSAFGAKMLNLYGQSGSNGKSLALNLISDTLNGKRVKDFPTQKNTAGISIMLLKDKNYTSTFVDKIFVYDPDLTFPYLPENISDTLKKYTAGDETTVEAKYENATTVRPSLLLAIGSNEKIKSSDKTGGLERRMSWFEIADKFPYDINRDASHKSFFDALFTEEASVYLFELILNGFITLSEIGSLIEPESVIKTNEEMHHANNSAQEWAQDMETMDFFGRTVKEMYALYVRDLEGEAIPGNRYNGPKAVNTTNWWYAVTKYHPDLVQTKLKVNSSKTNHLNIIYDILPLSNDDTQWYTVDKSCHAFNVIVTKEFENAKLKDIKAKSEEIKAELYNHYDKLI